jgi:hypothetical protein
MIRKHIDIAAIALLIAVTAVFSHVRDTGLLPMLGDQLIISKGMFRVASVPVCPYLAIGFK